MKNFNTGGTTGGTTPASQLGTSSTLSDWAAPYVTQMLGKGQALASMPYETYGGPLTAGPSTLQTTGFQGLGNLGMPTATTAGSFTGDTIQNYMNPYIEAAIQPQIDAATRQAEIARNAMQSQYSKAGAFGGGRQAVAGGALGRGLLDRISGIYGQGYKEAWDKGIDQFGKDRQYGLNALAAQLEGGAQQQALDRAGVLADIGQFEEQRDYPYKQVQHMQSLLQGLPISTESHEFAEASDMSNFMEGAGGVVGLLRSLGLLPS